MTTKRITISSPVLVAFSATVEGIEYEVRTTAFLHNEKVYLQLAPIYGALLVRTPEIQEVKIQVTDRCHYEGDAVTVDYVNVENQYETWLRPRAAARHRGVRALPFANLHMINVEWFCPVECREKLSINYPLLGAMENKANWKGLERAAPKERSAVDVLRQKRQDAENRMRSLLEQKQSIEAELRELGQKAMRYNVAIEEYEAL